MERRKFLGASLAATAAAFAPLGAVKAVTPTAPVAAAARYWATYMTQLHGRCTPQMLGTMLRIDKAAAGSILQTLVANGALKPAQVIPSPVTIAQRAPATHEHGAKLLKRITQIDKYPAVEPEDEAAPDLSGAQSLA